jgi:hypothetical protein
MTSTDRLRVHVDAVGPVLLLNPVLLHPTLPTVAGQPMATPVYGARCLIPSSATEQQLRRHVELIRAGIWPMGHPQQFIDPIRDAADIGHTGTFFYAASVKAPRLYREHQGRAVDFWRWADRELIDDMTPALVSITLEAAQTVPWAGGVDITLRSLLLLLLDRQPASADPQREAFTRALAGAPTPRVQEAQST